MNKIYRPKHNDIRQHIKKDVSDSLLVEAIVFGLALAVTFGLIIIVGVAL